MVFTQHLLCRLWQNKTQCESNCLLCGRDDDDSGTIELVKTWLRWWHRWRVLMVAPSGGTRLRWHQVVAGGGMFVSMSSQTELP